MTTTSAQASPEQVSPPLDEGDADSATELVNAMAATPAGHPSRGFAREFRRHMSPSSGASKISSLSMFVSFGATVRGRLAAPVAEEESAYTR
jgi:hypothetical protein